MPAPPVGRRRRGNGRRSSAASDLGDQRPGLVAIGDRENHQRHGGDQDDEDQDVLRLAVVVARRHRIALEGRGPLREVAEIGVAQLGQ